MLSYLHKVKDGAFTTSRIPPTTGWTTWVRLRGRHALQTWNPHSGAMTAADCKHETEKGQDVTRVRLVLEPVKSVFLIGTPAITSDTPR